MGLNLSKKVASSLSTSPSFTTACDAEYATSLDLAQHAFPNILPYQLANAAARLHAELLADPSLPIISRWARVPLSQAQVDAAYRDVAAQRGEEDGLTRDEFRQFAAELFAGVVAAAATREVALAVPAGVVGIGAVGAVAGLAGGAVGKVMIAYATAIAAAVYFTL